MNSRTRKSLGLRSILLILVSVLGAENAQGGAVYGVSLVQLLASPERFAGKHISVVGYFAVGPNVHLYLTEAHARVFDHNSSIALNDESADGSLTQSSCAGGFVRVDGEFGFLDQDHPAIVSVDEVTRLDTRERCWSRQGQRD